VQTNQANFKPIPISSFDFIIYSSFNSSFVPLEIVAVQLFSLSISRIIFYLCFILFSLLSFI